MLASSLIRKTCRVVLAGASTSETEGRLLPTVCVDTLLDPQGQVGFPAVIADLITGHVALPHRICTEPILLLVSDRTTSAHETELKIELKTRLKVKSELKTKLKLFFNSLSYRIKMFYFGLIPD